MALSNLGGTCYANAVLQLLRAAGGVSAPPKAGSLAAEVRRLFDEQDAGRTCAPRTLLQRVQQRAGARFSVFMPNDMHEFYVSLVDWLTECEGGVPCPPFSHPPAREAWTALLRGNHGPHTLDFYGLTLREIRCGECGHAYASWDAFSAILLDVPEGPEGRKEPASLSDMIRTHFGETDLNGSGGTWTCDRCRATGKGALARLRMVHAPRILPFAVNRYGGAGCRRPVTFPDEMSFDGSLFSGQYVCVGVGHLRGGHCVAAVRGPDGWVLYDDDCATRLPGPPKNRDDVKLVVYKRV